MAPAELLDVKPRSSVEDGDEERKEEAAEESPTSTLQTPDDVHVISLLQLKTGPVEEGVVIYARSWEALRFEPGDDVALAARLLADEEGLAVDLAAGVALKFAERDAIVARPSRDLRDALPGGGEWYVAAVEAADAGAASGDMSAVAHHFGEPYQYNGVVPCYDASYWRPRKGEPMSSAFCTDLAGLCAF